MGNVGGVVSGASGPSRNAESSAEKKSVIFPSQFHKIASIAKEYESQEAIETSGPLYVSDDDLRHELLCRINVPAHDCIAVEDEV